MIEINEYEVVSAAYASEDGSSIVMHTENFGAVMISERDGKELWDKLVVSGLPISAFVAPDPIAEAEKDPMLEHLGAPKDLG